MPYKGAPHFGHRSIPMAIPTENPHPQRTFALTDGGIAEGGNSAGTIFPPQMRQVVGGLPIKRVEASKKPQSKHW